MAPSGRPAWPCTPPSTRTSAAGAVTVSPTASPSASPSAAVTAGGARVTAGTSAVSPERSSSCATRASTTVTLSAPPAPFARLTRPLAAASRPAACASTSAMAASGTYDERPSLQSSTTSPSSRSTWTTSASTLASAPSARVITLRWGWVSASSRVMLPRRTSSATTEWSSVTWRSVAVAPQVRARVADVHHVEPAVVEHRGGEGGAHPGLVRVVAGEAPDRAVGPLHGAADVALVDGPHQPADRVDRHLGGHLAGLRAAHPVGDRRARGGSRASGPRCGGGSGRCRRGARPPPGPAGGPRCPRRAWATPGSGGPSGRSAARRGP